MSAVFSDCRRYRYWLGRNWGQSGNGFCMFIGLNPSTADETQDDPTIRRCIGYAKAWGYTRLAMTNLFAFRATDPRVMLAAEDPIGERNDEYLLDNAAQASVVIAAWGTDGNYRGRADAVRKMIPHLHYLKLTKGGHPAHPLYLPKTLTPIPFGDPIADNAKLDADP